jgi:riboflavin kinase / FMN adenylyltransferase
MAERPKPTKPFIVARDAAPASHPLRGAVVAIGTFDGVHRGHRAVIAAAIARAHELGRPAAALTFEPPPRAFFMPQAPLFRLTDEAGKLRLFAATGLDGAVVATFDAALAGLSAEEFIRHVLVERLAISGAAIGFNFHFGKSRAGTPDVLAAAGARLGFAVEIVPPLTDAGVRVSSGAIRAALTQGRVEEAARLLGFPWFVTGTVIHGDKRGRDLGFPTANIRLDPACGLRHGIYAVRVGIGGARYGGVASFGRRPTFDDGAPLFEVFLFDYSGELYGVSLDVAFLGWIREELRFTNVDALVLRMQEDERLARARVSQAGDSFPPLGELNAC